jgi:hypothetical protein
LFIHSFFKFSNKIAALTQAEISKRSFTRLQKLLKASGNKKYFAFLKNPSFVQFSPQ